jgi:ribosomal protein S18 acetylase RimI-like enzyme
VGAALTALRARVGPPTGDLDDHLDEVVRLVREVMAEGAALGWSGVPTIDQAVEWWAELRDEVAAGRAAVSAAYDAGELVGLGEWRRYQLGPQRQNADLEKLLVSRSRRGQGVGAALVEDLVAQARAAGVETVTLQCRGNNHGAIRLYERMGFAEVGRLRDFVAAGAERWDKVLMAIDLRTGAEPLVRHGSDPVGEGASS